MYVLKYYTYSKYLNYKRVMYEEFNKLDDIGHFLADNHIEFYELYKKVEL